MSFVETFHCSAAPTLAGKASAPEGLALRHSCQALLGFGRSQPQCDSAVAPVAGQAGGAGLSTSVLRGTQSSASFLRFISFSLRNISKILWGVRQVTLKEGVGSFFQPEGFGKVRCFIL